MARAKPGTGSPMPFADTKEPARTPLRGLFLSLRLFYARLRDPTMVTGLMRATNPTKGTRAYDLLTERSASAIGANR
jgi:hypothetical protein